MESYRAIGEPVGISAALGLNLALSSGEIKLQVCTKTNLSLMILEHIFKIYSKEKENELIN